MGRKKLGPIDRRMKHVDRDKKIAEYVDARLAGRRGDSELAIAAAAEHFHADARTIQRALHRHRRNEQLKDVSVLPNIGLSGISPIVELSIVAARVGNPFSKIMYIRQWITIEEWEQRGELSEEWAMEIARLREQLARLSRRRQPKQPQPKTAKKQTTRNSA